MNARRIRALAAGAALAALVVVPTLHGVHAPHAERAASFAAAGLAYAPAVHAAESAGCAICFAGGHARTALTTTSPGASHGVAPLCEAAARRAVRLVLASPRTPAAPRAPPLSA